MCTARWSQPWYSSHIKIASVHSQKGVPYPILWGLGPSVHDHPNIPMISIHIYSHLFTSIHIPINMGMGQNPIPLLFTSKNSWVKMDVHPPKNAMYRY